MAESDSPYAPPRTAVEDRESPLPLPERPPQMRRAVRLLWITLAVEIASAVFPVLSQPSRDGLAFFFELVTFALIYGITAWVNVAISRGRNWGRIVYFAFLAIGLLSVMASLPAQWELMRVGAKSPLQVLVQAADLGLSIYIAWLLLTRPAREWFRAMKERG